MDKYNCYIKIIKSILEYYIKYEIFNSIFFLEQMYYEYYINRNNKEYNLDDLYKKFIPLIYIYIYIYIYLIKNIKLIYRKKY